MHVYPPILGVVTIFFLSRCGSPCVIGKKVKLLTVLIYDLYCVCEISIKMSRGWGWGRVGEWCNLQGTMRRIPSYNINYKLSLYLYHDVLGVVN